MTAKSLLLFPLRLLSCSPLLPAPCLCSQPAAMLCAVKSEGRGRGRAEEGECARVAGGQSWLKVLG